MAGLDEDQRQADEAVSRSFSTENRDHVWNYLVRLRDGKVLKKLDGRHFGDRERYNHYTHQMFWSAGRTRLRADHELAVRQQRRVGLSHRAGRPRVEARSR